MLYCSSFSSICLVWINTGMKHKFWTTWLIGTANLGSVMFRAQWDDSLASMYQCSHVSVFSSWTLSAPMASIFSLFICFSLFMCFEDFHSPWPYMGSKGERGQATQDTLDQFIRSLEVQLLLLAGTGLFHLGVLLHSNVPKSLHIAEAG